MVFKNAFKRKLLQGRWKPVEETFKNEIKAKLIEYMQHFKEVPSLLKNIQSNILDIAEIDFPTYYKPLLLYIRNGYEPTKDESWFEARRKWHIPETMNEQEFVEYMKAGSN